MFCSVVSCTIITITRLCFNVDRKLMVCLRTNKFFGLKLQSIKWERKSLLSQNPFPFAYDHTEEVKVSLQVIKDIVLSFPLLLSVCFGEALGPNSSRPTCL